MSLGSGSEVGGLGCIAAALWFVFLLPKLRERVRPIYVQMGILPSVPPPEAIAPDM